MERYEAYKDSGIEWIGEIPSHWDVHPLGAHSTMIVPMRDKPTRFDGDIPWIRIEDFSGKFIAASKSEHNVSDELIAEMNLRVYPAGTVLCSCSCNLGVCAIVERPICSNQTFIGCVPAEHELDSGFLFYLMSSMDRRLNYLSSGTIQTYLSRHDFEHLAVQIPPIHEQGIIADYLDAKTAEIDALVADCEREVGLLREYRKAVISEAVTKGLDPDAPMKDSGVEWIGKHPVSWEYLKLGYTFDRLFDIDHWMPESTNEGYPYLMIGDLEELASRIDFKSCKHISEEDYLGLAVKGTPKRGDVIIARYATIGTGCFVDTDDPFLVTYACLTVTPKHESMRGRYLLYYTQSDAFERELFMLTNSNTQGNVGKDSLSKAHILLPPIDEQDEIVSALDASTRRIDSLIEAKRSMADKLREYRKSLISEAVTGKFKVPGVDE